MKAPTVTVTVRLSRVARLLFALLDFRDWCALLGLLFAGAGLALIYVPAALVAVGAALFYLGVWGIKPNGPATTS